MPEQITQPVQNQYNPRWFIWTIVFLVVSGVSLVSYIMLSDQGTGEVTSVIVKKTNKK